MATRTASPANPARTRSAEAARARRSANLKLHKLAVVSLSAKIARLRGMQSADPVQQLQTDVILALCDLVIQSEEANQDWMNEAYAAAQAMANKIANGLGGMQIGGDDNG